MEGQAAEALKTIVPPDTRQVIVHPPARWSVVVSFASTVGLVAFVVQQLLTPGSAIESVVSRVERSGATFLAGGLLFFVISLYVVHRLSADPTGVPLIFRCIPVFLFIIGFLGVAIVGHTLAMVDDSSLQEAGYGLEVGFGFLGLATAAFFTLGIFCGRRTVRVDVPTLSITRDGIGPFAWSEISAVKVIGSKNKPRLFLMLREPERLLGRTSPFPWPTALRSLLGSTRSTLIFDAELRSVSPRSLPKADLQTLIRQYEPAGTVLAAEQAD